MITVVGLGFKDNQITAEGIKAVKSADKVFVKTALTPTVDFFKTEQIPFESLDVIFEHADSFDLLDEQICKYILEQDTATSRVCFCVNGSGLDDRTVLKLTKITNIQIINGVSLVSRANAPCLACLTISAYELASTEDFFYDTRMPICVTDIDNAWIASEVKLKLSDFLGDEQDVIFAGHNIQLFELDRQKKFDYSCYLFISPLAITEKQRFNFSDLYAIMRKLRAPNGCPWDRAQTHSSIRGNAIEEAYELASAIDSMDIANLIEECGDVMLQSVFHCLIGDDCGEFTLNDVTTTLCQKLISRHTHIFGKDKACDAAEALVAWDNAKAKEKQYSSTSNKMKSIAPAMPALMRAKKVNSYAKKSGHPCQTTTELAATIAKLLATLADCIDADREIVCGQLLLAMVKLASEKNVDSEIALSMAIENVIKSFD